ncbi:MAG: YopX family protein [Ruminococcus sp.]|nr:YopX family protein [Ruminococcus sp.]
MREILFRAKRKATNEWVFGYFANEYDDFQIYVQPQIITRSGREYVNENTLGQFTGLTDKNGVKIFEGDLVKGTAYSGKFVGVIVWIDEIGGFGVRYRKRQEATAWENSSILKCASKGRTDEFTAEIIGNIYDNPELIGGAGYENNI